MTELEYNLIHRFNVGDSLRRSAARRPSKRAIHFMGRDITYAGLDRLSNQCARLLLESGIERGDAVGIIAPNVPEFVALFYACARIGARLVPVNLLFTAEETDFVLEKTRVRALFVHPLFATRVTREWPNQFPIDDGLRARLAVLDGSPVERFVSSEDAVVIIFTSGTTARPKGVVLTHLNWFAHLLAVYADLRVRGDDCFLLALPLFHVAGLSLANAAFSMMCDSVLLPAIRPEPVLQAIAEHKAGFVAFPATVWVGLLQWPGIEQADLSSLKRAAVFQYLPTPAFQRWRELAPHVEWINAWGQTETTALGSVTPPEQLGAMLKAPDPIGFEHLPLDLRVVDEMMNDVPAGQSGELVLRGPAITPGYFEDPEANEALFYGGWHHTGDIGYRDEQGCVYFVDRKKDMIKSGGENVSSQEVEEALSLHPSVAEVAVFGMPDPYWIEKVVAAVTLVAGAKVTVEELEAHARQRLASFKAPKEIFILEELPKNPSGKVLKRVLRERMEPMGHPS